MKESTKVDIFASLSYRHDRLVKSQSASLNKTWELIMISGSCLCENVTIEIPGAPKSFGVCHCLSCRKWTGGVFMSVSGGKDLAFSGEENISRYSSSDWAERGFCKKCGTHLFYRMKKSNHYFLMLGLFGDDIAPHFEEQQFIDEKPVNYSFSNETKLVTKAQMNDMLNKFLNQN